jgi:hypothetical protein
MRVQHDTSSSSHIASSSPPPRPPLTPYLTPSSPIPPTPSHPPYKPHFDSLAIIEPLKGLIIRLQLLRKLRVSESLREVRRWVF